MPAITTLFALLWLLTGLAQDPPALAQTAPAPAPPHNQEDRKRSALVVTIDLRDGSTLEGELHSIKTSIKTAYGSMHIDLADIQTLAFKSEGKSVRCVLRNGDVLHGALDAEEITVNTVLGILKVPCAAVRRISAWPHFTIAGVDQTAWRLSLVGVKGWDFDNTGGALVVTHIEPAAGYKEKWSRVQLSQRLKPRGDFKLVSEFAWTSDGAAQAMQYIYVRLLDEDGRVIAAAGHRDSSRKSFGSRYSELSGTRHYSGAGTLPASGRATVIFERSDGDMRVYWDGTLKQSGQNRNPLTQIEVEFRCWASDRPPTPVFGSETLHRLEFVKASGPREARGSER